MSQSRADTTYHTFREIVSQPQVWQATLQELDRQLSLIRELRNTPTPPELLFTGCGSPYYLARSAALLFQAAAGSTAQVCPASDLLLFPDLVLPDRRPRVLVAISRSGETTELLKAIQVFAEYTNEPTIAVTCYGASTITRTVAHTVVVDAAHEQSIAQTRSFTSMLLATQGVIAALAGQPLSAAFARLPEHCADLFARYSGLAEQIGRDPAFERFFFLGSGPLYGLACEAMLKMKEMSLSYSEAYQFLEFRHGPMSMVNDKTLIVGMVSERATAHELAVLSEMRRLGARVLAITPVELPDSAADYQVLLPAGLSDFERGALYLPLSQLMTFYRSLHNGLNPDQPTNLNAVVHLDFDAIEQRTAPEA